MKRIRVLVVEDSTTAAGVLRAQLETAPVLAEVAVCPSVAAARTLLASGWTPDAAVLDVRLPDGTGADVLPLLPEGTQVVFSTQDVSNAPAGYLVIAKGPRWVARLVEFIRGGKSW